MLIQLDQISSLIHSTVAQALAGGRKGQEGAFLVNLKAHQLWPQDLASHLLYQRHHQLMEFLSVNT